MAFNTHFSNRLEILLSEFCRRMEYRADPLKKETVVIQTQGMQKWMSLKIADYFGVCFNIEFISPNKFLNSIFQAWGILGNYKSQNRFSMIWEIMKGIEHLQNEASFSLIKNYLKENYDLNNYAISYKIADIFDQYEIYRTDMVNDWDNGNYWLGDRSIYNSENSWQPILWHNIYGSKKHRGMLYKEFLSANIVDAEILPERISIFGVSVLPKYHLNIFNKAGEYIDIDYYILSPCKEYWGDLRSRNRNFIEDDEYSNPFLASMGKVGQDMLKILLENDFISGEGIEDYDENSEENTLSLLQNDLLYINAPLSLTNKAAKPDNSIMFNSCHTKMREVEILYDYILNILNEGNDIELNDIVVMSPNIEEYSYYIKSIFDMPYNEGRYLKYSISDTYDTDKLFGAKSFIKIIKLLNSRFKISEVIELLEYPALASKFSMGNDLENVKSILFQSGVRWGIDGNELLDDDISPELEITWDYCLTKLMFGTIMSGDIASEYCGYYPSAGNIVNQEVLNNVLVFISKLYDLKKSIDIKRNIFEWCTFFRIVIDEFLDEDKDKIGVKHLKLILQRIEGSYREYYDSNIISKDDKDVHIATSADVVMKAVEDMIRDDVSYSGFLGRGITFCTMLPMRSIPFKVVCMIGMDDGTFPRVKKPVEFDLIAIKRRMGDRSLKDNDKYVFLEALISARKYLYLSYVGQSMKDNSTLSPSILISELLDYIALKYNLNDYEKEELIIKHKIHPFHKSYFNIGNKLQSFSKINLSAARAFFERKNDDSVLDEISLDFDIPEKIDIREITALFKNPVKYFYNKRLSVDFDSYSLLLQDNELFDIDYKVKRRLLKEIHSNYNKFNSREELLNYVKTLGIVPFGDLGYYKSGIFLESYESFYKKYYCGITEHVQLKMKFDYDGRSITIFGLSKDINSGIQVLFQNSENINAIDILEGEIYHNFLNAALADKSYDTVVAGISSENLIKYGNKSLHFDFMSKVIKYWAKGHVSPLHFVPLLGERFINNNRDRGSYYLDKVNDYNYSFKDPYISHYFKNYNFYDDEFEEVSSLFFKGKYDGNV